MTTGHDTDKKTDQQEKYDTKGLGGIYNFISIQAQHLNTSRK